MNPLDINIKNLHPADPVMDGPKILQRADVVWSKMKLERDEVLLVKVSKHMIPAMSQIKDMLDVAFDKAGDRVLIFAEGDIEFQKVTIA